MEQKELQTKELQFEDLNNEYVMQNNYLLVTPCESRKTLANGISVQDTKDRKDIMVGVIKCSHPKLKIPNCALVWFPRYAGLPLQLNDGKQYLVVNHEDVIMIEKVHQE